MATATAIHLSTHDAGIAHVPSIGQGSATAVNQVLQDNHDNLHIYMDLNNGLHNHAVHHILSAYALGASDKDIQRIWANEKEVQKQPPRRKPDMSLVKELYDRKRLVELLSVHDRYPEYLEFFQSEIEKKGMVKTVQEYVLAGDEAADLMLKKMYAGYLHPVIHFGFALEFNQPALVAEALAECASSSTWAADLLTAVEEHIATTKSSSTTGTKTLFDLQAEILKQPKLVNSVSYADGSSIRDGILKRAPSEMAAVASQWRVHPSSLARQTAEMINFNAYLSGAAQNPKKQVIFDFFLMHCLNASMFWSVFLNLDWITDEQKCRMLEMKGWVDLAMYVGMGSPELRVEEIKEYQPKSPGGWDSILAQVLKYDTDDAHTPKLIRALLHAQQVCQPYEKEQGWPVQGDMWLQLAHMVMDSVTTPGADRKGLDGVFSRWARRVGFSEAWEKIPDRDESSSSIGRSELAGQQRRYG